MAMTQERILEELHRLIELGERVLKTSRRAEMVGELVDSEDGEQWATSALTLLASVFGRDCDIYNRAQSAAEDPSSGRNMRLLYGVVKSAYDSWKRGYVFHLSALVRADVEADLIAQATNLLEADYLRAAVVVAGAALEGHLRGVAPSWGVQVTDAKGKPVTLEPLSIELRKAGTYDAIMRERIGTLRATRNQAAHYEETFNMTKEDVRRFISDVLDVCSRVGTR